MLILSPHLDDGVLSCGQVMAGREDCVVATVFAGCPDPGVVSTTFDWDSGWKTASAAHDGRRGEDDRAVELLRATPVRFDFLDNQYRELGLRNHTVSGDGLEGAVAAAIVAVAGPMALALGGHLTVLGPLGLAHPDHHIVRRAVETAVRRVGFDRCELWCYEDLPARVLWPETVPDALAWWRGMGWDPVLGFLGTGDPVIKEAAVRCYRSQITFPEFGGDLLHNVLVPERIYRMWRTTP